MLSRLLLTIATAVSLTGLYAVYAVAVRPLVVIPDGPAEPIDPPEGTDTHRPAENVRVAESYLPEQSWAAQSQYMLRAGQAFVFTNAWDREGNDQKVRFKPFAMVWLSTDKHGREQAVSLVSDSAQLKFASAFDEKNPNPGRVVGAVLEGEVQVKGTDGLAVSGKRFIFDESAPSLVTTNPVRFQYGQHKGSGRSLHMSLIPAEGAPGKDRPHVFGIRTVRLNSGIDPVTKADEDVRLDVQMKQQGRPLVMNIRGARELEYDVESQTAVFSQAVRVFTKTGEKEYDGMECDRLTVQFAAKPKDQSRVEGNPPPDAVAGRKGTYQQIETDLTLRRLTAEGFDGRKVKVVSQRHGVRAFMTKLVYDTHERSLRMSDPSDPKGVLASQRGATLRVPEIEVHLAENIERSDFTCLGAGRLETTRPGTTELAFIATWAKRLRKSTDHTTGLDLIELEQHASFLQPDRHTGLGAELIRIWLTQIPLNAAMPSDDARSSAPATEPDIRRLFAEREVALISPQLEARTNELDVRFDEAVAPPRALSLRPRLGLQPAELRTPRRAPVQLTAFAAAAAATDGSLGPPIDIPPSSSDDAGRRRVTDRKPHTSEALDLKADRIGVRLRKVTGQSEPEVTGIETHGHVIVRQKRKPGEPPLTAEGDRMYLTVEGPEREVIHLFGSPAHLRDRGLHIEGRDVHLDRAANRAWVNGRGLLQLPMPKKSPLLPASAEPSFISLGNSTGDPDLDVWWDEKMEFDGQTAKFLGNVRAELGLTRMKCEQMDVELLARLSFVDPDLQQQPDLKSIHCHENVSFENSTYEGTNVVLVARGQMAEFTLDQARDTVFAQGPGHMKLWRRGKNNQAGLAPHDVIQANRPITVVASDWNYTRVDFKGQMTGNIKRKRSMFHDSVRIVHGP
ncbi:MAG: hypothetical protein H7062_07315, partial [Candidatus Saccharimonas sp.]|nr:hypothetical protein [Planctomycetaceae bacterium]